MRKKDSGETKEWSPNKSTEDTSRQPATSIVEQSIFDMREGLLKHLKNEIRARKDSKPRRGERSVPCIKELTRTIEKAPLEEWIVSDYPGEDWPPHVPRGPPPRIRSEKFCYVTPLVDGEEIYKSLYDDLVQAAQTAKHIFIAMWQLETDFVIEKPPEKLLAQFITDALANNPDLQVYILLWRPPWVSPAGVSVVPVPNLSDPLKNFLESTIGPQATTQLLARFRFLARLNLNGILGEVPGIFDSSRFSNQQTSSRLHVAWNDNIDPKPPKTLDAIRGSHHQKFVLMDVPGDGASLHCLGLNFANIYWDSINHAPTPYPRPHHPKEENSWHDTGVRVVGQPIHEFEMEFRRRWENATGTPLRPTSSQYFFNYSPTHGHVPTFSKFNKERAGSKEVNTWYYDAISSAERYVYLENQYFSIEAPANALVDRYLRLERAGKKLDVAVVLPHPSVMSPFLEVPKSQENVTYMRLATANEIWYRDVFGTLKMVRRPKGGWRSIRIGTILGIKFVELGRGANTKYLFKVEKTIGGIRVYAMVRPGALKTKKVLGKKIVLREPVWVYVHSKACVVDDTYTIGSCNISKQSFEIDSEANVVVDDKEETARLLTKLWPPLLGSKTTKNVTTADTGVWLKELDNSARRNMRDIKNKVNPTGMLVDYPYTIPSRLTLDLIDALGI
ncbi:MAG: hypothetical protein HYY22_09040 [Thaumarchaeota archaeon]|nr:hypothetical protein [Nitrososphaerota archaeon]